MTRRHIGSLMVPVLLLLSTTVCATACSKETKLSITGLSDKEGPTLGGNHVGIVGTGFQAPGTQDFTVYFGKRKATNCMITSNTKLRCDAPAGMENEVVDVEVEFGDARRAVIKQAYKYIVPAGPGGADAIAPTPDKK